MSQHDDRKADQKILTIFIGILIAIFLMWLATSCKKQEAKMAAPSNSQTITCAPDTAVIVNRTWIPNDSLHADIKFASSGAFYQNTMQYATWSVKGCDSLKIQRPASVFYYRVQSVTVDSLVLVNPLYGPLKYHR